MKNILGIFLLVVLGILALVIILPAAVYIIQTNFTLFVVIAVIIIIFLLALIFYELRRKRLWDSNYQSQEIQGL